MNPQRVVCLLLAAFMMTGCSLLPRGSARIKPEAPFVKSATNSSLQGDMTVAELQSKLMGFADDFSLSVMHAAITLEDQAQTAEERVRIRRWKLSHLNGATILASGPNSVISLLDFTGMVTLGRMTWEEHWMPKVFGARGQELLEVHRRYEKEIWQLAKSVLKPEHQAQLREIINEWHATHPEESYGVFVALSDYAKLRLQPPESVRAPAGSFLSLFYLDPMAGLDPATQQLEQTRHFAERMFYYAQRTPTILRLQGELLGADLMAGVEIQKASGDLTQFRQTADRLLDVVERLPERLGNEQRRVIDNVVQHHEQIEGTFKQIEATFREGTAMAHAVQEATRVLDTFSASVSATNAATGSTNHHPFDVRDYGRSAEQIQSAAQQLNLTIQSLDRLVASPGWKEHGDGISSAFKGTERATQRMIQRIFWLALAFLLITLAVALFYRLVLRRMNPADPNAIR